MKKKQKTSKSPAVKVTWLDMSGIFVVVGFVGFRLHLKSFPMVCEKNEKDGSLNRKNLRVILKLTLPGSKKCSVSFFRHSAFRGIAGNTFCSVKRFDDIWYDDLSSSLG